MIMDVLVSHFVLCSGIDTSALALGTHYYNSYDTENNSMKKDYVNKYNVLQRWEMVQLRLIIGCF